MLNALFLFLVSCRGYVGIHSSGFRDFLLKPELLRAIVDSGFEHPSEGKLITCIIIYNNYYRSYSDDLRTQNSYGFNYWF